MGLENKIAKNSLMLAPMEGVTDATYRRVMHKTFPSWDTMACDFLRVPSQGPYPIRKIVEHYGEDVLADQKQKNKTCYQILTSAPSLTEKTVKQIESIGIDWIDLNLGCPSKRVNGHGGGSSLLQNLSELRPIVRSVRQSFSGVFTAKIRIGFHDDELFFDILHLLEEEGVEAITIHGRTRDQMYKGRASWEHIKKAVEVSSIPIIGNGDIWEASDVVKMLKYTGCHAVMCARGAIKTPWLADFYRDYEDRVVQIDQDESLKSEIRDENAPTYFDRLFQAYKAEMNDSKILKRFKGLSRYHPNETLRTSMLRTQSLKDFFAYLEQPSFHQ